MADNKKSFLKNRSEFTLASVAHDQSTYLGRVKHFIEVVDPRNFFVSNAKILEAQRLIEGF